MSLVFDPDRHLWIDEEAAGPAGICNGYIGSGVYATVDLVTARVLSLECISRRSRDHIEAVLSRVAATPGALQAIARLSFAQSFEADDSADRATWYAMDRIWARIDLERQAPDFQVDFEDAEFELVVQAVIAGLYERTPSNSRLLDQAFAALWTKTSQPAIPRKPPGRSPTLGRPITATAESLTADVLPEVIGLSHGVDLARALKPTLPLSGGHRDGVLAIRLPIDDPARWARSVDCYLVEPDRDPPVSAIGRFVPDGDDAMVVTFPVRADRDWSDSELVLVPSDSVLPSKEVRPSMRAEVGLRTATRLSQKGRRQPALDRARESIDVLKRARITDTRLERALDLLASIEAAGSDSGLLADR